MINGLIFQETNCYINAKPLKLDFNFVFHFAETGLEGMLFSMLDMETDDKLRTNIHDTLISMLHELAGEDLARWLLLCKAVLAASTGKSY